MLHYRLSGNVEGDMRMFGIRKDYNNIPKLRHCMCMHARILVCMHAYYAYNCEDICMHV